MNQRLRAATRLGDPSITLIPLYKRGEELFLEPTFQTKFNPKHKANLELAKTLLRRAVGLSNKTVYWHFANQGAPEGWRENALLKHARILPLSNDEYQVNPQFRIQLDPLLGIVYIRDKN